MNVDTGELYMDVEVVKKAIDSGKNIAKVDIRDLSDVEITEKLVRDTRVMDLLEQKAKNPPKKVLRNINKELKKVRLKMLREGV